MYQRILLVGDSGAGKTSAVLQLAEAGHRLAVADFDLGVEALLPHLSPAARARIHPLALADELEFTGATLEPRLKRGGSAVEKFIKALADWPGVGAPTPNVWLVIDPLSMLGTSLLTHLHQWADTGRKNPIALSQAEWQAAISRLSALFVSIRERWPRSITITHTTRLTPAEEAREVVVAGMASGPKKPQYGEWGKRYPMCLGQKLPPRFGGYFTAVLAAELQRNGECRIYTRPLPDLDVKVPAPPGVLRDYYRNVDFPELVAQLENLDNQAKE